MIFSAKNVFFFLGVREYICIYRYRYIDILETCEREIEAFIE